ncbi:MAG: Ig-like domain-containing protein [Gemmatimonadales bacterium]
MLRLKPAALAVLLAAAGCAQIGAPPGGPPDNVAPRLLATRPESLVVLADFKGDVEFQFDEVVNEGNAPNFGLGTGDLEKLVVLSPTTEVPVVKWKRSRIVVHPREGWRPNRVYRVELLPGLSDLANNRTTAGRVITFTTGAPEPTRFLQGRVVDWTTSRPVARALVEALLLPDSLSYKSAADSTGRFRLGPLPDGEYLVSGVIDANRNARADRREAFDSLRLAADRDSVGELWAFQHDTVGARIQTLAVNDSLSLIVTFNQDLDPHQRFVPDSFQVLALPDSTALGVDTVVTKEVYDSLFRRAAPADTATSDSARAARARTDSLAKVRADSIARADSLRLAAEARRRGARTPARPVDEGPLKTKPPLFDNVVIRVRAPIEPGRRYAVAVHGVRSVSGVPSTAILGIAVPERKAPDTTARDTTAARPDTAATPPDTGAAPPDTVAAGRRTAPFGPAPLRPWFDEPRNGVRRSRAPSLSR